jgi:DNA polymerase I-like protein with 3'-5' exonuclease and polymerase domains
MNPVIQNIVTLESKPHVWANALSLFEHAERFCLDIETMVIPHTWDEHPMDPVVPFRNEVRLIQIGLEDTDNTVFIIDLKYYDKDRMEVMQSKRGQAFFKILRNQCSNYTTEVVGHNLYFEASVLHWHYGIKIRKPIDTMIMSRMKWAGCTTFDKISHTLGALIEREMGEVIDKSQGAEFDWRLQLGEAQISYAANDVLYPLKLARILEKFFQTKSPGFRAAVRVECAVAPVLGETYVNGYPIDIDMVKKAQEQYQLCMDYVLKPFRDKFPDIKPTATSKTLVDKCFSQLEGFDKEYIGSKDDKGNKFDFHWYVKNYMHLPEVAAVVHWRSYQKHLQYFQGMEESYIKGAVHGYYNTYSPKGTGRSTCGANIKKGSKPISSTGINLQNPAKPLKGLLGEEIPKQIGIDKLISIRSCFRHPNPDYRLIIEDLPQAHLMIATASSKDKVLIEAYNNDIDQHALVGATMAQLEGYDWDWKYIKANKDTCNLCKGFRFSGKTANYSALNLAGVARLAAANDISEEQAAKIKRAHKETFPELHALLSKLVSQSNWSRKDARLDYLKQLNPENEYGIAQSYDGRELIMKKWDGRYGKQTKASEATAFHWLATEATIIKGAMCEIQMYLDRHPEIDAGICNLCHDEINLWVHKDHAEALSYVVHQTTLKWMKKFVTGMKIDGDNETEHLKAIGNSWADK